MDIIVELPLSDTDLIAQLEAIPGAKTLSEQEFDGKKIKRIAVNAAAIAGLLASTATSARSVVDEILKIKSDLVLIFDTATSRHRASDKTDFKVYGDSRLLLSTTSPTIDEDLQRLKASDDWFKSPAAHSDKDS